jgi:carbon starvation protein
MTTTVIIIIAFIVYMALYFIYGKKIERDVVRASDAVDAPSKRLYDGIDYVPANKYVLFGHHFASIAGAGPIIGPAMAMCWGWLPGLLWVWFGNVFIGAVHDYLALMASVRYDGKSVQFVASDLFTKRSGVSFYWIVFFLLVLVVAAFADVIASMFAKTGEIASASIYMTIVAIFLGQMIYNWKINLPTSTIIGVIGMAAAIWLGTLTPIYLSHEVWLLIQFAYIIIAAAIPVNLLLQPRDYLNSFLLYFGIAVGFAAAVFTFRGFEAPMVTSFAPILVGGKATPFWPAIPLIIACGSLSGFHSLVASGTSSKQLEKESDALFIGYGSMFTEGFLSTLIICAIGGFGFTALQNAAAAANQPLALTAGNWGDMYTKATAAFKLVPANMVIQSYADMVAASFLSWIPTLLVKVIAGLWISAFALTTLDTTNRIARYCLVEMLGPFKTNLGGAYTFLTNRWTASLIPAAIGIYLCWSKNFTIVWPAFGAANQLIASLALMTGAAYVAKRLKSKFAVMATIPALLLWVTVTSAIIWFMIVIMPDAIAKNPAQGWTVQAIMAAMLVLNVIFVWDFIRLRKTE